MDSARPVSQTASRDGTRGPLIYGLVVLLVFFGLFGTWAALAPIDSAAVASGVVTVTTSRRQVQHLEGGIVSRILVSEGSHVRAGDPLVVLSSTESGAALSVLDSRLRVARARRARLVAERDGLEEIDFAGAKGDIQNVEAARTLMAERRFFAARRKNQEVETEIMHQRIAQLESVISGVKAQNAALDKQKNLIAREHVGIARLVAKGLERKSRLLALERSMAEIERKRAGNTAEVARARQQGAEIALQLSQLETVFLNDVMVDLHEIDREIFDLEERIRVAADVHSRTTVLAPVDGTVVDLRLHTIGGVVAPGVVMLELLPSADQLIVEARIQPDDIDVVAIGLPARVSFSTVNQRVVTPVAGEVTQVSADRLIDAMTGLPYYLATIRLTDDPAELAEPVILKAGMNATVMIVTGERTLLNYLTAPIVQSMRRALIED